MMACSARISCIVPGAPPLILDHIPEDLEPHQQSQLPSSDIIVRNKRIDRAKNRQDPRDNRPRSLQMTEIPPVLIPGPPMHMASRRRLRPKSPPPTKEFQPSRDPAPLFASPPHLRKPKFHRDNLTRPCSSPEVITSPDTTRWTKVATRVHRRHSQQDKTCLPGGATTTDHIHRYRHVVQTDALAPGITPNGDHDSRERSRHQQPPWLRDNDVIDWATYFKTQPLPTSTTWSRSEATVDMLMGHGTE